MVFHERTGAAWFGDELTAYLAGFVTPHKLALFERVLDERTRHLTVALENVHRGHNASACLRSCEAFGLQDVHVIEERNRFRPNGEIALGAMQWLDLHVHDDTPGCLASLRERGFRIVATTPRPGARDLFDLPVDEPTALVFGTEKAGLTEAALSGAEEYVRIPMYGFADSFNLSVSVALCLQVLARRLRETHMDWGIPPADRVPLRRAWVRAAIGPARLPAFERRFAADREKARST